MKIPALRIVQNARVLYLAKLSVGELSKVREIDIWRAERASGDQGYQRYPTKSRLQQIARFIRKVGAVFPMSILLNARESLHFDEKDGDFGMLDCPPKLWLVDGQHRQLGVELAELWDFPMPVIITNGFSKYDEMVQFHTINTTQKRMPTDLVVSLLEQYAETPEGALELIETERDYLERAKKISDALNSIPGSCWCGRVQRANEGRTTLHIVRIATLANSIEPIVRQFLRYDNDTLTELVNRFWNAIRDLFPEAFDEPKSYLIQKSIGVRILHKVVPHVFNSTDRSEHAMKEALEYSFIQQLGVTADDWHGKNEQGKYVMAANEKAFNLLAREIVTNLPAPPAP